MPARVAAAKAIIDEGQAYLARNKFVAPTLEDFPPAGVYHDGSAAFASGSRRKTGRGDSAERPRLERSDATAQEAEIPGVTHSAVPAEKYPRSIVSGLSAGDEAAVIGDIPVGEGAIGGTLGAGTGDPSGAGR